MIEIVFKFKLINHDTIYPSNTIEFIILQNLPF